MREQQIVGITTVTLSPGTDPINVIENTQTTLQCRTSGGLPAASVRWFIQGSGQVQDVTSLSANTYQEEDNLNVTLSTLNYTPLTADQNGQIYCSANNMGVRRNSTKLYINVFYGPDRPLCKTNNFNITSVLKVIISTTFTISCTVDSNPAPYSWQWSPSGGSSQQLGFTNIQRIQGGEYTLQVLNRMAVTGSNSLVDGSNATSFTVDVLFPPAVPTLRMSGKEVMGTVKVIEGNSKTFNCSTESNPTSSYSWTYPRGSSSNNILQVSDFQPGSYDGDYTCQVQNRMEPSFGNSKENVSLKTISVDVLYGPKTGNLPNASKVRGENLVYQCLYIPGNPPTVDFEWTKSGTEVSWVKQNTQNLTILNLQRSDEASYTCKVSSVLQPTLTLATTTQYDTATFFLDILYGAENLLLQLNNVSQSSVQIDEHSSNHMRCSLESDPGSNMALTKDGKTIIARSGVHQLTHGIQAECSDAGVYTCSGYNQYGAADNASVQLFVKCSARRPTGVEVQLNFTARKHENATLVYKIVAYPVPKPQEFVWTRCTNRTSCELVPDEMNKFEIYTEGLSSKLTILDVQIEDYRLYQLLVYNGVGDTLVEWLHLRPIGKSDSPMDFHVIQDTIRETSAVLTWIAGFDNGSPQEFHISYGKVADDTGYITQNVKHDNRVEMNYTVVNLKPGTEYFVSLISANEEGSSAPVNVTFLTLKRINDQTQTSPNTGPVFGGAVGGTVGAIVAIVVVVIILRRNYALNCNVTWTKRGEPSEHSISGKDNPGYNAAETYEVVSRTTDTSAYNDLKNDDSGADNSHVYTSLEESKAPVYYENVKKDDPIYNNTALQNPVQTVL
ncbi:nephrin-like [Mya arenaria]|uniref:nephrin-like n=1 Tax=Mya arenaria TaxID=6604 RepID=UPI0022E53631|nr:nephrin-like [Mya arenaria]